MDILFSSMFMGLELNAVMQKEYNLSSNFSMPSRWKSLLGQGRRIFVVGDLNIAPFAIDRCDAGPDFEKNEFRIWLRSLLVRNGGSFFDVFREMHPERREAYTCWPTNSGAEVFNFGSRIDHILCAGSCLHDQENQGHSLVNCHVKECDILEQFKRWRPGNASSHKDIKSRHVKLEGSDHAPVFMSLAGIPNIEQHNTPSLSTRYCPQVYGCQQTLVSMFSRSQPDESNLCGGSNSPKEDTIVVQRCSQLTKRPLDASTPSSPDLVCQVVSCSSEKCSQSSYIESSSGSTGHEIGHTKSLSSVVCKKARGTQSTQLSLKSFFRRRLGVGGNSNDLCADQFTQVDISSPSSESNETLGEGCDLDATKECQLSQPVQEDKPQPSGREKNDAALVEWQRIRQHMQTSIPLCKGHKEPCVSRVVKKSGDNLGRRFYVCARAEGPAANPEANCGFFKWAATKVKNKK